MNASPEAHRMVQELGTPKVTCLCATYKRPHLLPHAIESFLRQDYPNRRLVILDDAGQYPDGLSGTGWNLVSTTSRFATLGQKRNAIAELADADTAIFAVWDDDDIYLPWHLTISVAALADGDVSIPSRCWALGPSGLEAKHTGGLFHPSWSYWKPVFERIGGYPPQNSGEDQTFLQQLRSARVKFVDPCTFGPRSFLYRWHVPTPHLSCLPSDGYERLAEAPLHWTNSLSPHWDRDWVQEIASFSELYRY